jgi:pimeloyl-ACP methyl ester carboxylesterase
MSTISKSPRRERCLPSVAALLVGGLMVLASPALGASHPRRSHSTHESQGPKPTIVLVHGAWADASSWFPVEERLIEQGYTVYAPPNPLRGVKYDSEYLRSFLATLSGPVVLVGHSYGGFVETGAATGDANVKALVYVAAFAPEEGESAGEVEARNPGSEAAGTALTPRPYPGGTDLYITSSDFHRVFCADLPARQAALMAASQRPLSANAFAEPSSAPAWRTIPSWYMVATEDHAIPPQTERFMARRMHAHTIEVRSSHVAMLSHPEATTKLIVEAAHAAG